MNAEYLVRVVRTADRVLAAGKANGLFGDEMNGWLAIAPKNQGLVLSVRTSELPEPMAMACRVQAEAHVEWLCTRDRLTSSVKDGESEDEVVAAVAVKAYDFYLGYASSAPRLKVEAFAVVTTIRLQQFSSTMALSRQWQLYTNIHIGELLEITNDIQ